jgi:hypothetical protein
MSTMTRAGIPRSLQATRRGRQHGLLRGACPIPAIFTGRGRPALRGAITGGGTFAGGIFHSPPFLIPGYGGAIIASLSGVLGALAAG